MPQRHRWLLVAGGTLLAVLLLWTGVYFVVRYVIGVVVERYTDTGPMALPRVDVSAAEQEALSRRIAEFRDGLDTDGPPGPLELTERDVNALIGTAAELKGRVYVRLEGNRITGQVSLPLEDVAIPVLHRWLKGRYLNGAAGFRVALEAGVLVLSLDSVEVNGRPLPGVLLSRARRENVLEPLYEDPDAAEFLRRFERIEVTDGKVVIRARTGPRPTT